MQFEISERYYRILQASLNDFIPKNIIPPDRIKNLQTKLKYQHDNATGNVVVIEITEREYRFLLSYLNRYKNRTQRLIEYLKSIHIHDEVSYISI